MISPGCATRTFAAGSTTMGGFVLRPSIQPCSASTLPWHDGRAGSSSPCAGTSGDPDTGWRASHAISLGCSLTGTCSMDAAEQWEPDDARVSRPVLRERGAAMPRAPRPFIKVHGQWRYLYRAIDRNGALVDVMFSEHRDMAAAKAFFQSAKTVTGITPDRVTTDGHDSYPRAIRTT